MGNGCVIIIRCIEKRCLIDLEKHKKMKLKKYF